MYEQYTSRQLYPIWDKNHIPLQAIPLKTVFANFPNEAAAFFLYGGWSWYQNK